MNKRHGHRKASTNSGKLNLLAGNSGSVALWLADKAGHVVGRARKDADQWVYEIPSDANNTVWRAVFNVNYFDTVQPLEMPVDRKFLWASFSTDRWHGWLGRKRGLPTSTKTCNEACAILAHRSNNNRRSCRLLVVRCPEDHFDKHRREVNALFREAVDMSATIVWVAKFIDDACVLQTFQSIREDIGGDLLLCAQKFIKARRTGK